MLSIGELRGEFEFPEDNGWSEESRNIRRVEMLPEGVRGLFESLMDISPQTGVVDCGLMRIGLAGVEGDDIVGRNPMGLSLPEELMGSIGLGQHQGADSARFFMTDLAFGVDNNFNPSPLAILSINELACGRWVGERGPFIPTVVPVNRNTDNKIDIHLRHPRGWELSPQDIKVLRPWFQDYLRLQQMKNITFEGDPYRYATLDPTIQFWENERPGILEFMERCIGPTEAALVVGPSRGGKSLTLRLMPQYVDKFLKIETPYKIEKGQRVLRPFEADIPGNIFKSSKRILETRIRDTDTLLMEAAAIDSPAGLDQRTLGLVRNLALGLNSIYGTGFTERNVMRTIFPDGAYRERALIPSGLISKILAGPVRAFCLPMVDSEEAMLQMVSSSGFLGTLDLKKMPALMAHDIANDPTLNMRKRVTKYNDRNHAEDTLYDMGDWVTVNIGRLFRALPPHMAVALQMGILSRRPVISYLVQPKEEPSINANQNSMDYISTKALYELDYLGALKVNEYRGEPIDRTSDGEIDLKSLCAIRDHFPYAQQLKDLITLADLLMSGDRSHRIVSQFIYSLVGDLAYFINAYKSKNT